VAASFQTPTLFQIAENLGEMEVDASVSESDIGGVKDGQIATFTVDAYPGRRFSGAVTQVRNAPVNVQNVVTYDVIISVENRDLALKPGMTATVAITTASRDDALRVPLRALSFDPARVSPNATPSSGPPRQPGERVWRMDAGNDLERVEIATGMRDEQFVEVTQGELKAGDAVVVAVRRTDATRPPAQSIPGVPRMR
jgi:HlyD family secretion protein